MEAEIVSVASVACVVEPAGDFRFFKVLGGGRRAWVPRGRTETACDFEIPGLRNHLSPMGDPDISKSVMAGPM